MLTRYLAAELAPQIRVNAEVIAGAAVYLASPAASYTTGEMLVCNGGRHW
jgi:enoyl-[acyl-carrier-protein] reductase (NADH)